MVEDVLLDYGPLGIMLVVAIVLIRLFIVREQGRADSLLEAANKHLEREQKRADGCEAEVRRLNDKIQDLVIPMMEKSAAANEAAIRYLQQMAEEARVQERLKTDRETRSGK
jgi:hypothetical protein